MLDIVSSYSNTSLIIVLFAYFVAVCFSIVFHEYAHAFVAYKNGDDTAKMMGRLTLNPIKHFDLLGALCFIFFRFGWAKPVPINSLRFRNYKKGIITTSIAGIVANLILGFLSMGLYVLCLKYFNNNNFASIFLINLFEFSASINISLMIFNLLPIYPLDGFNFISAFLPQSGSFVRFMRRNGPILLFIIMIILFRTNIFSNIIYNVFNGFFNLWSLIWRL